MKKSFQVKLKVILASEAPVGIIFRRGPSDYTQIIKWNTAKDVLEYGDWFKGSMYPDQSDVSPDGSKFLYLAANWKPPLYLWTAMSRPPVLTPFILWPCEDDFMGGGYFENNESVVLNLTSQNIADQLSFTMHEPISGVYTKPKSMYETILKQALIDSHPQGELILNEFIRRCCLEEVSTIGVRLIKDMDTVFSQLKDVHSTLESLKHTDYLDLRKFFNVIDRSVNLVTKKDSKGWKRSEGAGRSIVYSKTSKNFVLSGGEVQDIATNKKIYVGPVDWADWDKNGDLLFSKESKLFRWPYDQISCESEVVRGAIEIADFYYPVPEFGSQGMAV